MGRWSRDGVMATSLACPTGIGSVWSALVSVFRVLGVWLLTKLLTLHVVPHLPMAQEPAFVNAGVYSVPGTLVTSGLCYRSCRGFMQKLVGAKGWDWKRGLVVSSYMRRIDAKGY